jgi:hypothetical protein
LINPLLKKNLLGNQFDAVNDREEGIKTFLLKMLERNAKSSS